jgi:hypothetical protein
MLVWTVFVIRMGVLTGLLGGPSVRYLLYQGLIPQRLRIVSWFNGILMQGN